MKTHGRDEEIEFDRAIERVGREKKQSHQHTKDLMDNHVDNRRELQ